MSWRQTKVRPHMRAGIAVKGHDRKVKAATQVSATNKPAPLMSLSEKEPLAQFEQQINLHGVTEFARKLETEVDRRYDKVTDKLRGKVLFGAIGGSGATLSSLMLGVLGFTAASGVFLLGGLGLMVAPVALAVSDSFNYRRKARKQVRDFAQQGQPSRKEIREMTKLRPWKPTSSLAKKNLWQRLTGVRSKEKSYDKNIKSVSRELPGGAVKTSWKYPFHMFHKKGAFWFHPGANLQNADIRIPCDLRGANLQEANLKNSTFNNVNLDGANLSGADLSGSVVFGSMRETEFDGANLSEAELSDADLSGTDLTGANLQGAMLPADLTKTKITGEQFDQISKTKRYEYSKKSLHEALEELDISEERFEFLALSGVIEVRENQSLQRVTKKFNVNNNHVPDWAIEDMKRALAAGKNE